MIFRLLLILLVLAPVAAQELYQNREEGYSLEVPAGWEQSVAPGKVSLVTPKSEPLGSFDVVVEMHEGLELEEFVQRYLQIAGQDGARTLSQEKTEILGEPAVRLALLYPIRGAEVKMEVTIFLREERAFSLTGMAIASDFPSHRETFEAIRASFKFGD